MEKHCTVPVAHKRRILNFDTLLEQDQIQNSKKEARSPESRQNASSDKYYNNGTGQLKKALITHSIWTNKIREMHYRLSSRVYKAVSQSLTKQGETD